MTRILFVGLAGLALTACTSTTHETLRLDAAQTLSKPHGADASRVEFGDGAAASAWGDRWTANNLLARAAEDEPTVINRFNLAVAYEKTGRFNDAAPIYRQLETDGRYTWAVTMVDSRDRGAWDRRFNVARESAHRLAAMTPAVSALAPGAEDGVQAANAYASPVATSARDADNPTGIPNARAEALDAAGQ